MLHTVEKSFRAHEYFLDMVKMVVYANQLERGLRFPLDPFVKTFMNMFNITPGQLYPNSYRILTRYIELMHRESREPDLDMFRFMYRLNKKKRGANLLVVGHSSSEYIYQASGLTKVLEA